MIFYLLKRIGLAAALIVIGIGLFATIYGFALDELIVTLSVRFQNNPSLIGVVVGGITGASVAIIEGLLSIWRSLSLMIENDRKRKVIEALSYSPGGMAFDAVLQQVQAKGFLPGFIVQNILYELVMMGVVRIERTGSQAVMYAFRD